MFEARQRIFQKSFDPELLHYEREAYSVTLRRQKRLEITSKKRQHQFNLPSTSQSDTRNLSLLMDKLKEVNSRCDQVNLWKCILNLARSLDYNYPEALESDLFDLFSLHLNFNKPQEILEILTSMICDISHKPDIHTEVLHRYGIIESLFSLLTSSSLVIKENVIWTFTNMLASDLLQVKSKIIELGILKKLIKNVHLHELHTVISWSVKTISLLSDVIQTYHAKKIICICKTILERVEISDEIASNTVLALGFACRYGQNCVKLVYKKELVVEVMSLFSKFPLECSSFVGNILIVDQKKGNDFIKMQLLDVLESIFSASNSEVAAKVYYILEKLCRNGYYAISSLLSHSIFHKCTEAVTNFSESAQICWAKYMETLIKFSPNSVYELILTENLQKTIYKMCELASNTLKARFIPILHRFADILGEGRFFSTEEGHYFYALIEDYDCNNDMQDENWTIELFENLN